MIKNLNFMHLMIFNIVIAKQSSLFSIIVIYLSTTRISMQYHPWYIFFDIQRIFLEQKHDIPRIILEHEGMFCG